MRLSPHAYERADSVVAVMVSNHIVVLLSILPYSF